MASLPTPAETVSFGDFEVNLRSRELLKQGAKVRLPDQSFQMLAVLLERSGELVTREEIKRRLWPGHTFVDFDHGLNNAVNRLREALGDSAETPSFIETLPKRGYRFIGLRNDGCPTATGAPETDFGRSSDASRSIPDQRKIKTVAALAISSSVILIIAACVAWFSLGHHSPTPANTIMVAVLPFENLSGDQEQDYFSDGFTDEMIAQLGHLRPEQLSVIARTSTMPYKQSNKPVNEIGRELGVAYLLEGTVLAKDGHIRITAELIRTQNQADLWAESYDSQGQDALSLQRDMAATIAREVEVRLLPQEAPSRLPPARQVNAEAYELYLKGRYFWNKRSKEGYDRAIAFFQQAIAKQPNYAQAYAGLSDAYALLGLYPNAEMPRSEAMARARAAALKALEIDDTLAEAHASLASVSMIYDWNWTLAEKEFQRAIQLNPGYATAHQWYAYYCDSQGRQKEALQEIRLAKQLDPLSLIINTDLAEILYESRRYDEAIAQAKKTLQMDPTFPWAHTWLGLSYLEKQQHNDAVAELENAVRLSGRQPAFLAFLGTAYARSGRREEARRTLKQIMTLPSERYDSVLEIAWIYEALGEPDQSFAWIEKVYPTRPTEFYILKVLPLADPLRPDPRFQTLMRRLGLAL